MERGNGKEAQLLVMEVPSKYKTMVRTSKSSEALKKGNLKHLPSLLQHCTTPKLL